MSINQSKNAQLRKLANLRKKACPPGFSSIGDFFEGAYECNHVSPYSKTAGNVDAKIFVMLQDWCSADYLNREIDPQLKSKGYDARLPTNLHLESLLKKHFDATLASIYATNLFPFIKPAGMNATIPQRELIDAAQRFGLPQIRIVQPKLVIVLGKATFRALQVACGEAPSKSLEEAIASPFEYSGVWIWCQAHTGRIGTNHRNRGGINRVSNDWSKMRLRFQRLLADIRV